MNDCHRTIRAGFRYMMAILHPEFPRELYGTDAHLDLIRSYVAAVYLEHRHSVEVQELWADVVDEHFIPNEDWHWATSDITEDLPGVIITD